MKSKRAREAAEADDKPTDVVTEIPAKKRKRDGEEQEADVSSVKKSKKDKKDKKKDKESRKEKKDKKKDLKNLPDEDEAEEDEAVNGEAAAAVKVTAEDKEKEEKKREKKEKKKKEKKERQEAEASKKASNGEAASNGEDAAAAAANTTDETPNEIDLDANAATKNDRHIVFVGNLPFTATAASISAHFASLSPIAVRCLKNKNDDKPCRGIAFVEFGKVWHMRTCLDKFHHSTFDDGKSPARKINVELTAGGGGKTKARQDKIRDKNIKLDENRAKRIEKEKTTKTEGKAQTDNAHMEEWIHPSRRARVPGA